MRAFFFRGMDPHAHVGTRMQIEELPLLLVGLVVYLGIESGFFQPGGNAVGGLTFVERRNGDKLFHRFAGDIVSAGLGVRVEIVHPPGK